MKLNLESLIKTGEKISKIILLLIFIYAIYQISRESLGWAIFSSCFAFLLACWLHHEPDQHKRHRERDERIAKEARNQKNLIES